MFNRRRVQMASGEGLVRYWGEVAANSTERNSLGVLWGDLNVTPEDIAFQGAIYLRRLLEQES
jgi:hypothetical protein